MQVLLFNCNKYKDMDEDLTMLNFNFASRT